MFFLSKRNQVGFIKLDKPLSIHKLNLMFSIAAGTVTGSNINMLNL